MDFMKKNWLGVIGLIVGVLGMILSYYFYSLSLLHREPVVIETNNFSIFSSPKGVPARGYSFIAKPSLKEITKNVYFHELAIWNKGNLAIKKDNILKEIYLEYPEGVEVIDAFISSATRQDIINASEKHTSGGRTIHVSFDILEKGDGFTIQAIYASDKKIPAVINGSIEGVTKFSTQDDLTKENIYFGIGKLLFIFFCLLAIIFGIGFASISLSWVIKKFSPKHSETIKNISGQIFKYLFNATLVIIVTFALISMVKGFAEKEGKSSIPIMTAPSKLMNAPS